MSGRCALGGERPREGEGREQSVVLGRRAVLRAALGAAGAGLLVACGGGGVPPASPTAGPGQAPTARPTPPGPTATATARPGNGPGTATAAGTRASPSIVVGGTRAASPAATASPARAGELPAPQFPPPAPGVPPGYLTLPPPYRSVARPPGQGGPAGEVSAQVITFTPPIPPLERNRYWQELNARLGLKLNLTLVPSANYNERLQAVLASGDLPDLLRLQGGAADRRAFLQGAFTDLTPALTGDALREFPNLARLPDYLWRNASLRGKLYNVPRPLFLVGGTLIFRQDWANRVGLSRPRDAAEFERLLTAFTRQDPNGNGAEDTWGLGTTSAYVFQQMFRVPNTWRRNGDGSLTHYVETEEYRAAIALARKLYGSGLFFPDAATQTNQQAKDNFIAGKYGGYGDGASALRPTAGSDMRALTQQAQPGAEVIGFVPPGHDGGAAVAHNGNGIFGQAAVAARAGRDRARLSQLLRIVDYLAAPFASEEWRFINYGVEGAHHTLDPAGNPTLTDAGRTEIGDLPRGLASAPEVFYYPGRPEDIPFLQGLFRDLLAIGVDNPALALYSQAADAKGTELGQLITDTQTAVLTGRAPQGELETLAQEWRRRGGDQIRQEYEQELRQ